MRGWLTVQVCVLVGGAWGSSGSITLDASEMERARQAVFGGDGMLQPAATPTEHPAERWSRAMAAAGTDLMPVLLLALLQELNPQLTMAEHPVIYAEALKLHRLAAEGDSSARALLAAFLESGMLPGGLIFVKDGQLARDLLSGNVSETQ